jgi:hypothetical protein
LKSALPAQYGVESLVQFLSSINSQSTFWNVYEKRGLSDFHDGFPADSLYSRQSHICAASTGSCASD